MQKKLTYQNWNEKAQQEITGELKDFMGVLKWAYQEYGDDILYACSFGAEGIVLIDLISKVKPDAKIIFLDTDVHFEETYALIDQVKHKYPTLNIQLIKPELTLSEQENAHGPELWKSNPSLCCSIRKVQPLASQLSTVDAWISGLRREQSPTRKNVEFINKDNRFKSVKICPLIHWTWEDVWTYIKLNDLPYNELHDQHYPSIGCEKCTLPVKSESESRAGRWAGLEKTECGLHQA